MNCFQITTSKSRFIKASAFYFHDDIGMMNGEDSGLSCSCYPLQTAALQTWWDDGDDVMEKRIKMCEGSVSQRVDVRAPATNQPRIITTQPIHHWLQFPGVNRVRN